MFIEDAVVRAEMTGDVETVYATAHAILKTFTTEDVRVWELQIRSDQAGNSECKVIPLPGATEYEMYEANGWVVISYVEVLAQEDVMEATIVA